MIQKIVTDDTVFYFEAKTFEEKESWIGAIGKAMVKTTNNVFMGNYQTISFRTLIDKLFL